MEVYLYTVEEVVSILKINKNSVYHFIRNDTSIY